ncbi:MAG: ParB/RepB/Spo0J family partition protein [Gammaproteobacteria bacterium]|nr:ParB/RepB/Spo0J family partition protein [Gammaproteobacteria bacterium]MDH5650527.1 ParB/RepB/Spo0J family partition protein [Gammaproteobacteria bacterium]
MSIKKPGLGRGLDALLGAGFSGGGSPTDNDPPAGSALKTLPVDVIQRGRYQPRQDFEPVALQELADSIKAQGVVQPIVVRPLHEQAGRYEIIAGERRWRATQLAGLHEIPVVIRDVNDQAAMAMALIENIQREELNPMEEATALQRLIDEFALTHSQAAEAVGRSRAAVTNMLRLLTLSHEVKTMLEKGDIEMGHARALLALAPEIQPQAARQVVSRGLSVRETESLVRKMLTGVETAGQKNKAAAVDPNTLHLQESLAQKLGAKVELQHSAQGKGKLVISYNSLDELDGILDHIR